MPLQQPEAPTEPLRLRSFRHSAALLRPRLGVLSSLLHLARNLSPAVRGSFVESVIEHDCIDSLNRILHSVSRIAQLDSSLPVRHVCEWLLPVALTVLAALLSSCPDSFRSYVVESHALHFPSHSTSRDAAMKSPLSLVDNLLIALCNPACAGSSGGGAIVSFLRLLCDGDEDYLATCFPASDHELFTEHGFMTLQQVREWFARHTTLGIGCAVAGGALEFHPIAREQLVVSHGTHELIDFTGAVEADGSGCRHSDDISLSVTPNHNMYVRVNECATYSKVEAGKLQAAGYAGSISAVQLVAHFASGVAEQPDANGSFRVFCQQLGLTTDDQVAAFLELYGYWLGSGSLDTNEGHVVVNCSRTLDELCLDALFERLPLPRNPSAARCEYGYWKGQSTAGKCLYRITTAAWWELFVGSHDQRHSHPVTPEFVDHAAHATSGAKAGETPQHCENEAQQLYTKTVMIQRRSSASSVSIPNHVRRASFSSSAAVTGLFSFTNLPSASDSRRTTLSSVDLELCLRQSDASGVLCGGGASAETDPMPLCDSDGMVDRDQPCRCQRNMHSLCGGCDWWLLGASRMLHLHDGSSPLFLASSEDASHWLMSAPVNDRALLPSADHSKPSSPEFSKDNAANNSFVEQAASACVETGATKDEEHGTMKEEMMAERKQQPSSARVLSSSPPTAAEDIVPLKRFWWWVWRRCKDQLRLIVRGLSMADGCTSCDLEFGGRICTTSVHFRDELVRVLLMAGYSVVWSANDAAGGECGLDGKRDIAQPADWAVQFSTLPRTAMSTRNITRRSTSYTGEVWCVTVPTVDRLIMIRRVLQSDAQGRTLKASRPILVGNSEDDSSREHVQQLQRLCLEGAGMSELSESLSRFSLHPRPASVRRSAVCALDWLSFVAAKFKAVAVSRYASTQRLPETCRTFLSRMRSQPQSCAPPLWPLLAAPNDVVGGVLRLVSGLVRSKRQPLVEAVIEADIFDAMLRSVLSPAYLLLHSTPLLTSAALELFSQLTPLTHVTAVRRHVLTLQPHMQHIAHVPVISQLVQKCHTLHRQHAQQQQQQQQHQRQHDSDYSIGDSGNNSRADRGRRKRKAKQSEEDSADTARRGRRQQRERDRATHSIDAQSNSDRHFQHHSARKPAAEISGTAADTAIEGEAHEAAAAPPAVAASTRSLSAALLVSLDYYNSDDDDDDDQDSTQQQQQHQQQVHRMRQQRQYQSQPPSPSARRSENGNYYHLFNAVDEPPPFPSGELPVPLEPPNSTETSFESATERLQRDKRQQRQTEEQRVDLLANIKRAAGPASIAQRPSLQRKLTADGLLRPALSISLKRPAISFALNGGLSPHDRGSSGGRSAEGARRTADSAGQQHEAVESTSSALQQSRESRSESMS